jgi:hypothetical protein
MNRIQFQYLQDKLSDSFYGKKKQLEKKHTTPGYSPPDEELYSLIKRRKVKIKPFTDSIMASKLINCFEWGDVIKPKVFNQEEFDKEFSKLEKLYYEANENLILFGVKKSRDLVKQFENYTIE